MTSKTSRSRAQRRSTRLRTPGRQRGVVMAITLIALALLLIGAAAMLRTVDTSGILAGNLAFRRDLANRSEGAAAVAGAALDAPGGVPTVLVDDSAYAAAGYAATSADKITLRWVIDRQCASGTAAFSTAACESVSSSGDAGGSSWLRKPNGASRPVYRISIRVTGPRDTEAYFQSTFAD